MKLQIGNILEVSKVEWENCTPWHFYLDIHYNEKTQTLFIDLSDDKDAPIRMKEDYRFNTHAYGPKPKCRKVKNK